MITNDKICYITVTGNAQDRLTIVSKTGRRINCGWNLSDTDCENVIRNVKLLSYFCHKNNALSTF